MTIPISVVVLAKNEEAGIRQCVEALTDFDEVIVVDSHSGDDTVALAEAAGARVVQFTWNGSYPKKKQWSLEHAGATHDWILLLDADESPTPELVEELRTLAPDLPKNEYGAYDIWLLYKFAGQFLQHGHKVVKRSLLNRHLARFPEVNDLNAPGIGEVEGHYQPDTEHGIGQLQGRIAHDDRDPVASWFDRHNKYSGWEAHLLHDPETREEVASHRSRLGRIWDKVPAKPVAFFGYSYVVRGGFLDGRAGFDYAMALSFYYWQIRVKYREVERLQAEAAAEALA